MFFFFNFGCGRDVGAKSIEQSAESWELNRGQTRMTSIASERSREVVFASPHVLPSLSPFLLVVRPFALFSHCPYYLASCYLTCNQSHAWKSLCLCTVRFKCPNLDFLFFLLSKFWYYFGRFRFSGPPATSNVRGGGVGNHYGGFQQGPPQRPPPPRVMFLLLSVSDFVLALRITYKKRW